MKSERERSPQGESGKWQHDLCPGGTQVNQHAVFVRNLPRDVDESRVRRTFEKFGEILAVEVERDSAEVFFRRKESAVEASETANLMQFDGKILKVTYYGESKEPRGVREGESRGQSREESFDYGGRMVIDTMEIVKPKPSIFSRISKPA